MTSLKKIIIREMEFDDLKTVFALGESLFTADKWPVLYRTWDEYEIIERFISDSEFCLVAESGDKIVGFALGTIIEKKKSKWGYGYLLWLGVSKKSQGLGVGRKLINALTKRFVKGGVNIMMADTAEDNEEAQNFFKKHGFDKEEKHVYMFKNLSEQISQGKFFNLR
ncbi:GNAT family N-acetyltransferase [Candidatus Peregrinibacteria bacterium]|jgi:ribosomal protein S18 acetylase RimI-like enzyme|nr:GNAT family N-acetyltransferase [Candidatus Peregrinibacteria bacterium]